MRKPYRERAAERENMEWTGMAKKLKSDRLLTCFMLFVQIALLLAMSWHGWDGSAFSFSPPAYLLLALLSFPAGALVLALVTGNAVLGVFRDMRDMKRKMNDFKEKRGIRDGQ
jgi:hypothetical protein